MVSDNGPGIDPKIIDQIFDPYFTTRGLCNSSGMGLAVVHTIVKNHKGVITVESQLGKGVEFTMLFPMMDEKKAEQLGLADYLASPVKKSRTASSAQKSIDQPS